MSYRRNSETVGGFLLRVIPPIDWNSLTENQAKARLEEIRDRCREYYQPKPRETRGLSILEYRDEIMALMLAPMMKEIMAQAWFDRQPTMKLEKVIVDEWSYVEPRSIYHKEFTVPKFEVRGAGKNPFAVPHISKPPRK